MREPQQDLNRINKRRVTGRRRQMRKLSLGEKNANILHSVVREFTDAKTGAKTQMRELTVLIEEITDAPVTVFTTHNFTVGKCKCVVSVTGKAKGELKFSITPIGLKGEKAA